MLISLVRGLWSVVVCLLFFLILVFWWCDCDSLVDEWSDSGGGVVLGESWDEDPVWLGKMVVYLIVIHGIWGNRVAVRDGVRGSRFRLVILLSQVDSQHWLKFVMVGRLVVLTLVDGGSGVGCDDEWWMMIRCFEIDDSLFRLRFTCYLLLMFFVFVWLRLTVGWSGV